jgi:hypothetical protein
VGGKLAVRKSIAVDPEHLSRVVRASGFAETLFRDEARHLFSAFLRSIGGRFRSTNVRIFGGRCARIRHQGASEILMQKRLR